MIRIFRSFLLALCVFAAASVALAQQQDSTVEWKVSLQDLSRRLDTLSPTDAPSVASWRADAEELRESLTSFADAHPDVEVPSVDILAGSPSMDMMKAQWDKLNAAVNRVIAQTPGSPFHLGTLNVIVSAETSAPSPVADSVDQTAVIRHDFVNIAKALDYLPGVEIQHIANNRNEAGIMIRGFSTRGQVPFYQDDIPISVPYDGFVDFNRFLTSDLAEVQVARGYTSPLLGPNALGGAINLVTKEPVRKFEGEALIGTGSGNALLSSLRLGTRWQHFFLQGTLDWLQSDFIPLSGGFTVHQYTALPDITMTDHLNHSASRDERYSGRVGWTPRGDDEYVFSYITQKGLKGVPLYQGPNTASAFRNFWQWPYWNMNSYYFHSTTAIGEQSSINFRAFYNQFKNAIDMFPNDTYVYNQTSTTEEHSAYDEHTDGASTSFTTRLVKRNVISGSFFFKDDTHKEFGIYPGRVPHPFVTPDLLDRDQQASIGLQDAITITSRVRVTGGFSADHFDGLQGEAYNNALSALLPFTCLSNPTNNSVRGCTLHAWNYNPQVSASYQLGKSGNLFATFAYRSRFPMLKDIYSSGLLAGLPNPDLQPEHSRNWNVGYAHSLSARTLLQFELFRSDLRSAIESVSVTDPGNPSGVVPQPAGTVCPNGRIPGFCSQMVNIGKEVHEGFEMQARTTLFSRLTLDGSYSYLNRTIAYDFVSLPTVSKPNTTVLILPTLPKNKLVGTATVRLPRQVLAIVSGRYEGGLTLQDTSYAATSPLFQPFSESFGTMDLGAIVPIYRGAAVQAGIKNVFDKNYYYTAGYPEEGRNWYVNLRYQF